MDIYFFKNILSSYIFRLTSNYNLQSYNILNSSSYNTDTNNQIQVYNSPTTSNDNTHDLSTQIVNILIICHNMKGGTEKYVRDIIELNKQTYNNHFPNKKLSFDFVRIKKSNIHSTFIIFNNVEYQIIKNMPFLFSNKKKYDIVHIHYINEPGLLFYDHIINLFNSHVNPKLIITLHDYNFIVNDEVNEFHLTIFNSNNHQLSTLKSSPSNFEKITKYKILLNMADIVVTGSLRLKNIYNYIFDLEPNKIKVVPHPEKIYFNPIYNSSFNKFNICVIGSISITKGSYMIQNISNNLKSYPDIKIYHLGNGFNYNKKKPHNIISLGSYLSENDFRDKLIANNINVFWFPAFRHESYCYTLSLAMQTSLPIIAFDSGTFSERLSFYKYPYKIHMGEYTQSSLLLDIVEFCTSLKNNSYSNTHCIKHSYDDINYDFLYS
jgi:hypothetical protein